MNRYAPWRRDYATGAARLLVGLLLVWAAWRASAWFVVATGVLLILMGRANVARGCFGREARRWKRRLSENYAGRSARRLSSMRRFRAHMAM